MPDLHLAIDPSVLATDRAEVVSAILDLLYVLAAKHGPDEGMITAHIALALVERGAPLTRDQSDEILDGVRDNVDEAVRRLGTKASPADYVLELAVIG